MIAHATRVRAGTHAYGVRVALDECGGHAHELDGLDASGNRTWNTTYHYHAALEANLDSTLEATPRGLEPCPCTL